MDTTGPPFSSGVAPSIRWSVYAGAYLFVCATLTAFLLSDVLVLLGDALGLPAGYAMFVLASPALAVGAVGWWALVERRGSYTYLVGAAVGLLTALLTGLVWIVRFVSSWGVEFLLTVGVLVGVVLGWAVAAGVLAGLPLMYARRRWLADERTASSG